MSDGREHLSALDATFLELEQADEGATMHIGGVMVFDPLPGGGMPTLEALRATIAERLGRLPRYSQRLSSTRTGGLSWPCWTDGQRGSTSATTSCTPPSRAPGGEQELASGPAEFFSHRLDRTRPLWEMVLLEGLADGRWAIASKTHHSMVDGVGSVGVVQLLLDLAPDGAEEPPARARRPGCAMGGGRSPATPASLAGALGTIGHTASSTLHAALHPREALERSRALVEVLVSSEFSALAPHDAERPDRRDPPLRRGPDQPLGRESHGHELGRLGQRRAARGLHGRGCAS